MKVIFLDVDGVLNSRQGRESRERNGSFSAFSLEAEHLKLLKKIVDATDAKIVLSSSWRYRFWDDKIAHLKEGPLYYALCAHLRKYEMQLYDVTPYIRYDVTRGDEIRAWLNMNRGIERFVILDDENDFYASQLEDYLVQVSSETGLTEDDCSKAINKLTK